MGNKKKSPPPVPESVYILPLRDSTAPAIIDTHTHLASTYQSYIHKYPQSPIASSSHNKTVFDFVKTLYDSPGHEQNVESIVDVWCEAPVQKNLILEFADAALQEKWGKLRYRFVAGVHPHNAKEYDDKVEADIIEVLSHPLACGLGEIGLDFHYTLSPADTQREVFTRQLRLAIRLGHPLTIHTREAEADTEEILKREVPKEWRIHIHCFTDTPAFAVRLLDHFPNLYIGITGVVTFATNLNTRELVRQLGERMNQGVDKTLKVLLETDAPYMVPSNIYPDLVWPEEPPAPTTDADASPLSTPSSSAPASGTSTPNPTGKGNKPPKQPKKSAAAPNAKPKVTKLAVSHSAMIPWTAEFVAGVLRGDKPEGGEPLNVSDVPQEEWTANRVLRIGKENAKVMYGLE